MRPRLLQRQAVIHVDRDYIRGEEIESVSSTRELYRICDALANFVSQLLGTELDVLPPVGEECRVTIFVLVDQLRVNRNLEPPREDAAARVFHRDGSAVHAD